MSVNDLGGQFALDVQGLQRLQHTARQDPNAGLPEAARQFEALFLHMMLKSMRDASPQSGLFDSQQSQFYNAMLDQQWSQHLAGRGFGLAEQLINQLEGRGMVPQQSVARTQADELIAGIPRGVPRVLSDALHGDDAPPPEADFMAELDARRPASFLDELDLGGYGERRVAVDGASAVGDARRTTTDQAQERGDHVQRFLTKLSAPAQAASRATGVPAELILAQAALETGWGRHEIPTASGGNSYNVFGIKAGSRWQGATTEVVTHEYVNGKRTRVTDSFRVYGSYEEAFTDYARLIGDNPRYAGVVGAPNAERAAHALQAGGYATDPHYASKLIAVMNTMGPLESTRTLAGVFFSY
ncbi:flagellar assembly peptidoglycan hydrolase FlgJ [Halomonas sp. BC1]|jgi:flagellar protein FlgJ|uniref:flagellar assembly peptidoglycan hydrolase FlgJ n=1 Tax=Halomonas sp. BC1 TaxID=1670448 RepID=UPI0009BF4AEB|nr:flagellar assembly peptidoglycan hydrolase FlgJ [Halomonas sp. BC1]